MSPCCSEKLPRSNFPSRNSFALFTLCKVDVVLAAQSIASAATPQSHDSIEDSGQIEPHQCRSGPTAFFHQLCCRLRSGIQPQFPHLPPCDQCTCDP